MRILYVTYIPFSTGKDKEDFSQFLHYYIAYSSTTTYYNTSVIER